MVAIALLALPLPYLFRRGRAADIDGSPVAYKRLPYLPYLF